MSNESRFVVFEGLDGAGTTTQIFLLAQALRERGVVTEVTKEPTNGPFGATLRQIIEGRVQVDPVALAKAFGADRSDHLTNQHNGIEKALAAGAWVLCDRYLLSSLAYQHEQGLSFEQILSYNDDVRIPDLTLFFEANPKTCAERLWTKSQHSELFHEVESLGTIAKNYLLAIEALEALQSDFPTATISAEGSPEVVHQRVLEAVLPLLAA